MNKQELIDFSKNHADKHGFALQPDLNILNIILDGLLAKEKQFGARYCPCRRITDDFEKNQRIICPCVYHEKEIQEDGHCKCFLFVR